MGLDVTVLVGTYGLTRWVHTAQRAIRSAQDQAPVIHRHATSLAEARNEALAEAKTEWVIHLDADDELTPGYIEAMAEGSADLRAPAVSYVRQGNRARPPYVPRVAGHDHVCEAECLRDGNFIVIGALARREMLLEAGGWQEWPVYEDWALWLACWNRGASVEVIPDAVYRAHVRPDSRNRAPAMEVKNRVHREIVAATLPDQVAA